MKTFALDPDQTRRWHKGDCVGYQCWCDCPDAEFMGRVKTRILDPRDLTTEWSPKPLPAGQGPADGLEVGQ
jgi:hypothetical protein